MNPIRTAACAILLIGLPLSGAAAQDFDWSGRVGPGQSIEIKGVNGEIEAVAASGSQVRVTALKTEGSRGDADLVTVEMLEHAGGITICAVYPSDPDEEPNECAPGSQGRMNTRDNDTRVDFRVEVPSGVAFNGRTVNGRVQAIGLGGDVDVRTVNGDVVVETDGMARASTVNGELDISMGDATWAGELELETVNGDITVTFTGDLHSEVGAQTVSGSIATDYPLTVEGRFGPRRLRGTVGQGGRLLSLSTVNGSIELRRR